MPTHDSSRPFPRRSFFSKLGLGLVGGAAVGAAAPPLQAQSRGGEQYVAARHTQDDWLDQIPGKHRYIVDAPNPDGFSSALQFTTTFYNINVNDYGLKDGDLFLGHTGVLGVFALLFLIPPVLDDAVAHEQRVVR